MAETNELIGGYKLRSLLQTGQQSQVFEVTEPTSGRHFAMKILLPEFSSNGEYRRQLFHEAEVGIKMRHENVINILKVSRDETNPHFVMEFFPSGSLRGRLMSKDPRDKQFVKDNAKKIFKQVATGLAYMNASGYIHSDMKPDNVLVNALGQTKIIDFAISRKMKVGFMEKLFPAKRKYGGTHTYVPPEQIRREILDQRADIYSYGIMLYELATGRPPFRGASLPDLHRKHLLEKPLSPQSHNPDVTDAFANFVLRLLEKHKEKRPENFHQVMIELKKLKVFKSDPDTHDDEM